MSFGMNCAEVVGRLGGRVANLSIATDESCLNRQAGENVQKTEWHRVVTFQDGLIDLLERNARKGRLVHAEDSDRFSTEILVVAGHRVQFLDKPNGVNGAKPAAEPAGGETASAGADESRDIISFQGSVPSPHSGGRIPRSPDFFVSEPESSAAAARAAHQSPVPCPPKCARGRARHQQLLLPAVMVHWGTRP